MPSKTSKRTAIALQREEQAIELRRAGAGFQEIANTLGIAIGTAHKAVTRSLARARASILGTAEDLRELEIQRLDRMLLAVWKMAQKGNLQAVDRVIRIMERRAKLVGLDVVVPVDLNVRASHDPTVRHILENPDLVEAAHHMLAAVDLDEYTRRNGVRP